MVDLLLRGIYQSNNLESYEWISVKFSGNIDEGADDYILVMFRITIRFQELQYPSVKTFYLPAFKCTSVLLFEKSYSQK